MVIDYPTKAGGVTFSEVANPSVDAGFVHINWVDVEPTEGAFDWSRADASVKTIEAAGKLVVLDLVGGHQSPDYVAQPFNWVWEATWGQAQCSIATSPLPWDFLYQKKYADFIYAAAGRYANDPKVWMVKVGGLTASTDEVLLPRRPAPTQIPSAPCLSYNDVANWTSLGYTQDAAVAAFKFFLSLYDASFPTQLKSVMLIPQGFPDDKANSVENAIITACHADPRCVAQNNGLSQKWLMSGMDGWQALKTLGTDLPAAIDLALAQPTHKFVEIYEPDIINSANQTALAKAHAATTTVLARKPRGLKKHG